MKEFDDLEEDIAVWYQKFAEYAVPIEAYTELFDLAFRYRAKQISRGDQPLPMDATLLIAQWIGENGLKKRMREREIDKRRTLPETAESRCPRCMGLGKEYVFDAEGKQLGVKQTCDHRPLVEGEWLYQERERIEKLGDKPIEIKTHVQATINQMIMEKVKPVADDGREFLEWCGKEFIQDYLNAEKSSGAAMLRKFKYQVFGRVWHVRLTEAEAQQVGTMIHHAIDYIRLGPQGYAALKQREAK
jgi:hypothetical protein